ncbi:MAG: sigma factor [Actinomycetes bacterium]
MARFQRRVFGMTLSILRDRGAADEAAQETFVRAWRHSAAAGTPGDRASGRPHRGGARAIPGW